VTERSTVPDVLYVGFLTGHGGDANQMLLLADGVHRRGCSTKLLVPDVATTSDFASRCRELDLPCERTPLIKADMGGPRQRPTAMIDLVRSLRSPVVHFHTGNSCLPRTTMLALELVRADRSFATIQSPYETIAPRSLRARWWSALAARRLHAVVSPSEHGSDFQRRCGVPADRVVTIRNSIDTQRMSGGDGARPRAELGLAADEPLIVFTSRMDAQKRPVDAVRIVHRVAERFPTAALAFIGNGDESDAVAACAAELGLAGRVHLMGYRTDIADWLAAATVWILPTERENFSVAVLEALAAGCAVLSTPCRGNDEVLVDGENALTFPIGDIDAGASQLSRLLDDRELRRALAARGVQRASAYSVDQMVDSYLALYERFGAFSRNTKDGSDGRS
jgi:glycosyltransferase involved in cell wall biosynthesis